MEDNYQLPENETEVQHFFRAFGYSVKGIKSCYRTEMAFRMELKMIGALFPLSFLVAQSLLENLLLIASLFLVVIVELLNTAIENVIDKTIPQQSNRAGMAKDQGSAAVFMSLWLNAIIYVSLIVKNFSAIIATVESWF